MLKIEINSHSSHLCSLMPMEGRGYFSCCDLSFNCFSLKMSEGTSGGKKNALSYFPLILLSWVSDNCAKNHLCRTELDSSPFLPE